jgi:FxsC-like protein
MPDYWFFLSYSRNDNRDQHLVEKFYRDLAEKVATKAALGSNVKAEEVGFWDQESIPLGAEWKDSLRHALQTSKTLVSLYSTSYFKSDYCGKEWQAFRSRLDAHLRAFPPGTALPPLILPVLWDTYNLEGALPRAVSEIDFDQTGLGANYTSFGLDRIIRLNKYADDYQEFLIAFAQILVDAASQYPIQGVYQTPSIHEIVNPFSSQLSTGVSAAGVSPATRGPRYAKFVFVAGKREEMRGIRQQLSCYGMDEKRIDWCPYREGLVEDPNHMIGIIAQKAASDVGLVFEPMVVDRDLVQQLRQAEAELNIAVLIVDPWSLHLQDYEQLMREYDQSRFINSGLLIPWNIADQETNANAEILRGKIMQVFERIACQKDMTFRPDIRSRQDLRDAMMLALNEVRRQIASKGHFRPVPSEAAIPTISGS